MSSSKKFFQKDNNNKQEQQSVEHIARNNKLSREVLSPMTQQPARQPMRYSYLLAGIHIYIT